MLFKRSNIYCNFSGTYSYRFYAREMTKPFSHICYISTTTTTTTTTTSLFTYDQKRTHTSKSDSTNKREKEKNKEKKEKKEGQGGAPFRFPVEWGSEEFYDQKDLEKEMRRVFDVCHGCRRCFNLCESFPQLFTLVDESPSGELDTVPSSSFKSVVDECTLCDMCFMNKCPYVPPHSLNIDFPHLMLRYRTIGNAKDNKQAAKGVDGVDKRHIDNKGDSTDFTDKVKEGLDRSLSLEPTSMVDRILSDVDKTSPVFSWISTLVNKLTEPGTIPRKLASKLFGIHQEAALPRFVSPKEALPTMDEQYTISKPNKNAPAYGKRKALLYTNCNPKWNNPAIGKAAKAVLEVNGVDVKMIYPSCCGMPKLECGDIKSVVDKAKKICSLVKEDVSNGWDVVSLVPSCSLMLKQEWSSLMPNDTDVKLVSNNTYDISEYIVDIYKQEGLVLDNMKPLEGPVSLHHACHSRALNLGFKANEMLSLIPEAELIVHEACSGHGGSWGIKNPHFPTAMNVGKRLFRRQAMDFKEAEGEPVAKYVVTECPLAGDHILQGLPSHLHNPDKTMPSQWFHPIQLLALSYGL